MSQDDRDPPSSAPSLPSSAELRAKTGGPHTYGPDDLVKSKEAARILGLSVYQLRHWVEHGRVPVADTIQEPGYKHAHKLFRVKDLRRVRRREQRRARKRKAEQRPARDTSSSSSSPHGSSDEDGLVEADVFQLLREKVSVPDIVIRLQVPVARVEQIARAYRQAQRPPVDVATMEALNDALSIRGFERIAGTDPVTLYRVFQFVLSAHDSYRHRCDDYEQALSRVQVRAAKVPGLERQLAEAERQLAEAREEAEAFKKKVERQHYVVERASEAMWMGSPEEGRRFQGVVEAAKAKMAAEAEAEGDDVAGDNGIAPSCTAKGPHQEEMSPSSSTRTPR